MDKVEPTNCPEEEAVLSFNLKQRLGLIHRLFPLTLFVFVKLTHCRHFHNPVELRARLKLRKACGEISIKCQKSHKEKMIGNLSHRPRQ